MSVNEEFIDACIQGNLSEAKRLYSLGADIHMDDDYALCFASYYWDLDFVKFLVGSGANIHVRNDEPFRFACQNRKLDVAQYLASIGANIHVHEDEPLRLAKQNGYTEIVDFLESFDKSKSNLSSSYNSICPKCKSPAYQGLFTIDCINGCF